MNIENFLDFENNLLLDPKTFFHVFGHSSKKRTEIIFGEFLEWQNDGGKLNDFEFSTLNKGIITWKIGKEFFAQTIDQSAPFSMEQYKKALQAVFSFMDDRPQYYKFRNMKGMFNPLRLLLYKFL